MGGLKAPLKNTAKLRSLSFRGRGAAAGCMLRASGVAFLRPQSGVARWRWCVKGRVGREGVRKERDIYVERGVKEGVRKEEDRDREREERVSLAS